MASLSGHVSSERLLHFALCGAQVLLASFFASVAVLKLALHGDRLVEVMTFTAALPLALVRGVGVLELLGAIAVAAPAVTARPQRIVGWAAFGFLVLMVGAATYHLTRGELAQVPLPVAVGALAGFVAWGRLSHAALESLEQT